MTAPAIRIGVLTPHATPGPEVEFAAMAGGRVLTRVARVTGGATTADGEPASPAALRVRTTPPHLDRAVEALLADPVDVIGHASTTTSYVLGIDAETALLSRVSQRTGLPVAATGSAAVHALRILAIERVALIGAPWFRPEYNDLGAAYFTNQGFDVVSSESVPLHDPRDLEPDAIVDWTQRHVGDTAQAIVFGGNGFRTAAAIQALEAAINRPVLTANQVLLWQLLHDAHAALDITGYGRLFTHQPDQA